MLRVALRLFPRLLVTVADIVHEGEIDQEGVEVLEQVHVIVPVNVLLERLILHVPELDCDVLCVVGCSEDKLWDGVGLLVNVMVSLLVSAANTVLEALRDGDGDRVVLQVELIDPVPLQDEVTLPRIEKLPVPEVDREGRIVSEPDGEGEVEPVTDLKLE